MVIYPGYYHYITSGVLNDLLYAILFLNFPASKIKSSRIFCGLDIGNQCSQWYQDGQKMQNKWQNIAVLSTHYSAKFFL